MKKKVYRSRLLPFFLFWNVFLTGFVLFACVLVILNPGETLLRKIYALLGVGIYMILSLALFISALTNRLEVSSEGVTYDGTDFRMYTPWHNIVGITQIRHPLYPFHNTTVFVLRQSALLTISLEEGKRQRLPIVENYWYLKLFTSTPMNYLWYLPLPGGLISRFDWEQGELGAYVRQFAPSIVEAMKLI